MNILNVERDLEQSLANLATTGLPAALEGLRHLPVSDRSPQVSIRYQHNSRKVRADADASYFDPESCEVVIRFESPMDDDRHESNMRGFDGRADVFDSDAAIGQVLIELEKVESTRPFVGLRWFRDHVLPECGYDWSHDSRTRHLLLRHATDQRVILTSQIPNPDQPQSPVTAIRTNRRHARFQTADPGGANDFVPVRIRGGLISDTVLRDRH